MDWLAKRNAEYFQEQAAAHAEWALDHLLNGDLESAVENQEEAATAWYAAAFEMGLFS